MLYRSHTASIKDTLVVFPHPWYETEAEHPCQSATAQLLCLEPYNNTTIQQYNTTIQHNAIICNVHNVCQLAESEAWAVAGGTWQG